MEQQSQVKERAAIGKSCLYCVHLKTEPTRKVVMDLSHFKRPELFNKFGNLYKCEVDNSLCETSDWLCEAFIEQRVWDADKSTIEDAIDEELQEFAQKPSVSGMPKTIGF